MGKESLTQIQEAQQVPYKINPRTNTPRHIQIKLTKIKDKEKILKKSSVLKRFLCAEKQNFIPNFSTHPADNQA